MLVAKLSDCGYSKQYIQHLVKHTQFCKPHWLPTLLRPLRTSREVAWLVLPFHPLLVHLGLKQAIAAFLGSSINVDLLYEAYGSVTVPDIRVAWKLSTLPFYASLVDW